MNTAVIDTSQISDRREIAPASEAHALIAAIERAARDPNVDIEKMERLFAMRKEIVREHTEAAFNAAMSACQAETRPISADAENPQTRSMYASYAQLDRALRPIYTKHGFAVSYDETDCPKPEHVRVLAYVSHSAGFTRTYRIDMPADGKGAKGGDVMTKTHAVGAATSYGMRYLLKRIFNVAIGEDDDDGNGSGSSSEPPVGAPEGYAATRTRLSELAKKGTKALRTEWEKVPEPLRTHAATKDKAWWDEQKKAADLVDRAALVKR